MPNFLSVIRNKIPRHFTQVLATLAVSLGPFAAGLGKGYSSPALASLQESKNSFSVSAQEGSWVASLSLLGAMFGCLFGGLMLQLGRKMSLLIIALPFSGSWLLTVFAHRIELMYSTSFIGGFCSAITLLATQVYVSEISHPEIRGCLSAVLKMAGHLGTLSSFALGAFLDWRQLAAVAASAPILLFLTILPIPETPSFLLYHRRDEEAFKSLTWLRPSGEDLASEMEILRSNISSKKKSFIPKCSAQLTSQLFITCGLMFFQKFSGVTVFSFYAVPIFKKVFGRSLNPHGAAIVVVFLQLLGSMTSGLLIDTAGRLPLLTLSNLFISGSFFGFGLYNWMEESLPPSHPGFGPSLDWIPLTCVLFFTLFFSIGIGPISWLMVGELFPLEYRNFCGALSTSFSYACAFVAVKTYVDINNQIGLYGAFWIYSAVSIAGLFFVCCLVPETRGVELEEMDHHRSTPLSNSIVVQPSSSSNLTSSHGPGTGPGTGTATGHGGLALAPGLMTHHGHSLAHHHPPHPHHHRYSHPVVVNLNLNVSLTNDLQNHSSPSHQFINRTQSNQQSRHLQLNHHQQFHPHQPQREQYHQNSFSHYAPSSSSRRLQSHHNQILQNHEQEMEDQLLQHHHQLQQQQQQQQHHPPPIQQSKSPGSSASYCYNTPNPLSRMTRHSLNPTHLHFNTVAQSFHFNPQFTKSYPPHSALMTPIPFRPLRGTAV